MGLDSLFRYVYHLSITEEAAVVADRTDRGKAFRECFWIVLRKWNKTINCYCCYNTLPPTKWLKLTQKHIILQFWIGEFQNLSNWAKDKIQGQGWFQKGNRFCCLVQLVEPLCIPWPMAPSSQCSQLLLLLSLLLLTLTLPPPPSSCIRTLVITLGSLG